MWKSARALHVSSSDGEWMATLVSSGKTTQRVVRGARIVLGAGAGQPNNGLAKALGISRRATLVRRRHRYREAGAGGLLQDVPRSRNTRRIPALHLDGAGCFDPAQDQTLQTRAVDRNLDTWGTAPWVPMPWRRHPQQL